MLPEQPPLYFPAEVQADGRSARALLVGVPADRLTAYGFSPVEGTAAPEPGQIVLGARVAESIFDQQGQRAPVEAPLDQTWSLVARRVQQAPLRPRPVCRASVARAASRSNSATSPSPSSASCNRSAPRTTSPSG